MANSTLCAFCNDFFKNWEMLEPLMQWLDGVEIEHQKSHQHSQSSAVRSASELFRCAANGCHPCAIIERGFLETARLKIGNQNDSQELESWRASGTFTLRVYNPIFKTRQKGRSRMLSNLEDRGVRYSLEICFRIGKAGFLRCEGLLETITGSRSYYESTSDLETSLPESQAPNVSISTNSKGTFDVARMWLERCTSNHRPCSVHRKGGSTQPTRLLDLRGTSSTRLVRVCEPRAADTKAEYLCLSHCWGNLETIQLREENLKSLKDGIYLTELPILFRNAVRITLQLGYSYLWIDSLCIIQNSESDWQAESRKMGSIYQNSVCTIAALVSRNNAEPLFTTRKPTAFEPCILAGSVAKGVSLYVEPDFEHMAEEKRTPPLHKRAWVFQEHLLSPRTLYFGTVGIFWECMQLEASEFQPEEVRSRIPTSTLEHSWLEQKPYKRVFHDMLKPVTASHDIARFVGGWSYIMKYYTTSALTYPQDRLVAIQGLANILEVRTGLTYYAGLWKEFLPSSLLWMITGTMPGNQIIKHPVGHGLQSTHL